MGTLAYALAKGSTAVGTLTRAEGEGAIAFGRNANVFSDNAIAAGNKTQVLSRGGAAYGLNAISGGTNSIAIGTNVYANTEVDYANTADIYVATKENGAYAPVKKNLLGYDAVTNQSISRGLYAEDLNGIARTVLGVAEDEDDNNREGFNKGTYLKSGDYFIHQKSYIDGLENALTNSYSDQTLASDKGTNSIAIKRAEKNGVADIAKSSGKNAIVIGSRSGAFGTNAIALGRGAFSKADNSLAIGSYSFARDKNALAIGIASRALGENAIALGNGAGVEIGTKNSMVFGHGSVSYANNSTILGINTRIWNGDNAVAIGNEAIVEKDDSKQGHTGSRAIAIGNNTKATLENSVALGYLSETDYDTADLNKPGYVARGSYSIPSSAKVGIISVGKQGYERRIANVAAGHRDTDAVNVAQLKTVEDKIRSIDEKDDNTTRYFSINKKNGNIGQLDELGKRETKYKNYVQYLSQALTVQARKKDGENINESDVTLVEMSNKLKTLYQDNVIKTKATKTMELLNKVYNAENALFDNNNSNNGFVKKTSGAKYWDEDDKFKIAEFLKDLEDAKKYDMENVDKIYTDAEIASLNDANFTNKGAYGNNSIAIGYKSQTGRVSYQNSDTKHERPQVSGGQSAIALGNEAKAYQDHSIALGSKAEAGTATGEETRSIAIGIYNSDGNRITKAVGNTSIALGVGTQALGNDSISIGRNVETQKASVSIGGASKASGEFAVAIGYSTQATAEKAIAIGNSVKSEGTKTVVIGYDAGTLNNSQHKPTSSIIIGDGARVGNEAKVVSNGVAIGTAAKTFNNNGIAIGNGAQSNKDNSIALGNNSVTTANSNQSGYDPSTGAISTLSNTTWRPNSGELAIGNGSTNTRRITGVAAGTNDTDAVNVAQLKKVSAGANLGYKATDTQGTTIGNTQTVALTTGLNFKSSTNISTSTGANGEVTHTLSNNLTDINSITKGTGKAKIDINDNSITFTPTNGKSITIDNTGKITGIANGTNNTDAVNVSQLNAKANVDGSNILNNATNWRTNLDVYSKAETTAEVNKAKDEVAVNGGLLTLQTGTATAGGSKYTIGLVADKVKEAAGTKNLGELKVNTTNLTLSGPATNRLIGSEDLTIDLSQDTKNTLASVANKADNTLNNVANITEVAKNTLTSALDSGNLDNPSNKLITDTKVKAKLDTKLDKSDLVKNNLNGDTMIQVTGNGKILDSDLTISIKDSSITKAKLESTLANKIDTIDNKLDTSTFNTEKAKLETSINNKADKDLGNVTDLAESAKTLLKTKLSEGASIETPTGALVTDTLLKSSIANKITLNDITSTLINSKLTKGTLSGTGLTVTGTGKLLDGDLSISIDDNSIAEAKLDTNLKTKLAKIATNEANITSNKSAIDTNTASITTLGNYTLTFKDGGTNTFTRANNSSKNIIITSSGNAKVALTSTNDTGTYTISLNETEAINANAGKPKNDTTPNDKHEDRLTTEKAVVDYVTTEIAKVNTSLSGTSLSLSKDGNTVAETVNLTSGKLQLTGADGVSVDIEKLGSVTDTKGAKVVVKLDATTKANIDAIGTGTIDNATTKNKTVTGETVKTYVDARTFKLKGNTTDVISKTLDGTINIEGANTVTDNGNIYVSKKDNDGLKIELGKNLVGIESIKKADNKSGITLGDKSVELLAEDMKITISKDNTGISLTGLTDRDLNKSNDYGTGTNLTRAATEGALKALATTLGLDPSGNTGTGQTGNTGPAGKDGLNGSSIIQKVDSLRDGTAGNIVYTKDDGTRLQKANDGKYYEADSVTKDGNKIVSTNDGKKYAELPNGKYKEVDPNTNEMKVGASEVEATTLTDKIEPEEVTADKIILSTVNPNGETTTPLTLGNIASALGLDGKTDDKDTSGTTTSPNAIGKDKAQTAINNLLNKKGAELNKAVTLGDIQALAQAGLDFGANVGTAVHKTLGSKLEIIGKADVKAFTDYSTDNVATNISNDGKIEIGILKVPTFESLKLSKTASATIDIEPTNDGVKLTRDKANGQNDTVKLSGLTDGTIGKTSTDAITGKQIHEIKEAGLKFAGNDNQTATVKLGETLKILGEGTVSGTTNNTATNNIKVSKTSNDTLTIGLAKDLVNIDTITTTETANKQKASLSSEKLVLNRSNTAGTTTEEETEISSKSVSVSSTDNLTKMTADGIEMLSKNDANQPLKNVLNKSSITLTDTTGGVATKNDIHTITASSTTLSNKDGDSATVKANEIKVANGTEAVVITKNSVLGAKTLGKDKDNSIVYNDDKSVEIKIDGKGLKLTKDTNDIRISNLAKGKADTDAVNVSQLKPLINSLGGNAAIGTDGSITAPTYTLKTGADAGKDTKAYTTVGDALSAIDTAISGLTNTALSFEGNDGTNNKVSKKLGETLKLTGEGTVVGETASNNIKIERNTAQDGLEVKLAKNLVGLESITTEKDGNKSTLTSENLTFGAKDATAGDKTSTSVSKDGISVKGKDGKTDIEIKAGTDSKAPSIALKDKEGKDSISLTASDGTNASTFIMNTADGKNDSVTIEAADGTNGAKLRLSDKDGKNTITIDGEKKNISGLADIAPDEKDGSLAANKNYVDSKIKEIAGTQPFEYVSKDDKSKVVRGLDGKLYKEEELNNYYYNGTEYKPKDKTADPNTKPKELANTEVIVNLMPMGDKKEPIAIGNIESVLGKDSATDKDKAAKAIEELIKDKGTLSSKKDNVATGTDIAALSKAGINFKANTIDNEKTAHSNLGATITIKGEGTDKDQAKDFTSASGNIRVDAGDDTLTIKLSDKLTNMTSFETKDLTDEDPAITSKVKLDKDGLKTVEKKDKEYVVSLSGSNGLDIGKYDKNPLEEANKDAKPKERAEYKLDGTTLTNDKGTSNLTSNGLALKDKAGNNRVNISSGDENKAPTIDFTSNGKALGEITGLKEIDEKDPRRDLAVNKGYVDDQIGQTKEKAELALGGVANAVAMANLVQASSFNEYRHQLSAAYGYYGSQHALAIGFSGVSEGRKVVYRVSGSVNNIGNLAFGAGMGVMLGEKMDDKKDDMPIELHNRIKELEAENKENKEINAKMKKEVEDIKKENEEIKKENQEIKDMLRQLLKK